MGKISISENKGEKKISEVLKLEFAVNNKDRNTTIDCCQPGVLLCGYHFLLVLVTSKKKKQQLRTTGTDPLVSSYQL